MRRALKEEKHSEVASRGILYETSTEYPFMLHAVITNTTEGDCSSLLMDRNRHHTSFLKTTETLYFHDGVRHIDYIMAYEEEDDAESQNNEMRKKFEDGLKEKGLELEIEPKELSQDDKTCFVKIHVPWDTRLKYAERMKMKMPLKDDRLNHPDAEDPCCNCHCITNGINCLLKPFQLQNPDIRGKLAESDYYTSEFSIEKQDFFDIENKETFFTHSETSRMAYRIMSETQYGLERTESGISALLALGVFSAAYPLHEGNFAGKSEKMDKNANLRRLLYWEWARWGRWYKFQPLDLIRTYLSDKIALYFAFLDFYVKMLIVASLIGIGVLIYGIVTMLGAVVREYVGDKVAIYFAWLGFYTQMLLYPTFVGVLIFIYGIASLWIYPPVEEVCNENFPTYAGNLTMCPLCDTICNYWKLKTSCLAVRITYVFDNEATIFFAIFMSLWATMFLEFWKRRQFKLAYDWDLVDFDEDRDLVRPEFESRVTRKRINPVTGKMEPYLAAKHRYSRATLSWVTVLFWVLVILAAVFAIIIYRITINAVFAININFSSLGAIGSFATPALLTTITASVLSLFIIMLLNKVYESAAIWLTNMELPRTQIDFEDSFTLKMFCFQFVNYYSYLFYVAFFKTTFAGHPGNYTYLFGSYRWDQCEAGGCMYELSIQLLIIMLGKQMWSNLMELILPWLKNKYRQWKSKKASTDMPNNEYTRWEQDFDLEPYESMSLFYEYLEMVIQFGFVTLFVIAFPLAPVLALINNIIEIRLDANKFICEKRRPLARKCSDIGAWYVLLEFIGDLAVITNAFTLAISSEAIPKLVYYYVYSLQTYPESTMRGYTENKLSIFNVSDFASVHTPNLPNPFPGENITECRYPDYRNPPSASQPYSLNMQYWHVIAGKLAFVIVMEHVVFFLKRLMDYFIPDRSPSLKEKIKREHFLVQDMIIKAEKEKVKRELSQVPGSESSSKLASNQFFSVENESASTLA